MSIERAYGPRILWAIALFLVLSFLFVPFSPLAGERINGSLTLEGTQNYCADAGASDTYACNPSPALTAYTTGSCYIFKANTANTGAATLNLNSLGAKTIKKAAGGITTDLADNDIRSGQVVSVCYDGTNLQMQSTLGNAASGGGTISSDTYANCLALATTSGNLCIPTNSPHLLRANGSAWIRFLAGVGQVEAADQTTFTDYNLGSATVTSVGGTINILGASSGARLLQGKYESYTCAGSPLSITAFFTPWLHRGTFPLAGIGFTDGTAADVLNIIAGTDVVSLEINKYTNSTTSPSTYGVSGAIYHTASGLMIGIRLTDDCTTNRTKEISLDGGRTWALKHTVARTDFLTPTAFGFFVDPNASSSTPGITVFGWTSGN